MENCESSQISVKHMCTMNQYTPCEHMCTLNQCTPCEHMCTLNQSTSCGHICTLNQSITLKKGEIARSQRLLQFTLDMKRKSS